MNYNDIDNHCVHLLNNSVNYYLYINPFITTMYNTGLRIGEVIELERWSLFDSDNFSVFLEKNNGNRIIRKEILPTAFVDLLSNDIAVKRYFSIRQLRYFIQHNGLFFHTTRGNKDISSHIFRYRFIRELFINGYTYAEIKAITHQSSTKVVENYNRAPIYGVLSKSNMHLVNE